MANSEEVKFTMKVVINKEKNKVLFAEIDNDFADVLLSFLTLPLGTIVKILSKHSPDQAPTIGSLNTLYRGLSNLDSSHFGSETGKQILLNARNSFARLCRKLKINLDDSEQIRYFTCQCFCSNYVAINRDDILCNCEKFLDREIVLESSIIQTRGKNGVFTPENTTFLITDDLQVRPCSVVVCKQILDSLGIRDTSELEIRTVTIGFKEIIDLLEGSLVSRTPLSNIVFNKRQMASATAIFHPPYTGKSATTKKIIVNAIIRKSTHKIVFVQANEDFINFLFGLLVIPLGRAVHLLGIDSSLGSVNSLYWSVGNLDGGRYMKNKYLKSFLLNPQIPPEYLFENQIFSHNEDITLAMPYSASKLRFVDEYGALSFVNGPAKFMVTDDLVVTPFSTVSTFFLLNSLEIPVFDIEEQQIEIGMKEALNILKASLTSTSALTDSLLCIQRDE